MEVITYKCPNCGGALKFNEDAQKWKCEFCISYFDENAVNSIENRMNTENDRHEKDSSKTEKEPEFYLHEYDEADNVRAYSCNSCGAEIVTDATTAATFCYYCHNPAIIPSQLSGNYRPSKIIPFKINRESATKAFIKWCRKKPLVSRRFITDSQLKLLSGVYIPFWLFDCEVSGSIYADARNVRSWTSGNKRYTETKYYDVYRAGAASFRGIPADGSKKAEDCLMETLEPYDYGQLEDFSMSYLSGYMAEKYDVNQNEVYGRIRSRVHEYIEGLLRDTINGYSTVTVKSASIGVDSSKASYALLPVWMFTYSFEGKIYIYAMNGQTGKIAGSLPISKSRALAWFGGISASVFAILTIGGLLL
ncbi:MAG: hypothetical protein ACOZCL_15340 [Bacillota bacterium]